MDPDGRFSHTELGTRAGLLTLHPEGDGTLHGNTVTDAGVGHVRGAPWSADGLLLVEGSTIAAVATAARLAGFVGVGEEGRRPAIRINLGLALEAGPIRVERLAPGRWLLAADVPLDVDDDGLPVLRDGRTWPLEE
jgi:hypothetical protein